MLNNSRNALVVVGLLPYGLFAMDGNVQCRFSNINTNKGFLIISNH